MYPVEDIFNRSQLLLGSEAMQALGSARVILFGVGGVGSWCAEGLIRTGITHLTIVDSDDVSVSNINRQLQATTATVGRPKVEVLKERLLQINPEAEITAIKDIYTEESCESFELDRYDYIIDAVDSLKDKISLLLRASESSATLFSSMGAALKVDPTRIRVAEFWDVKGCPLGSLLRKRMRQAGTLPAKKFLCVYDDEVLENKGITTRGNEYSESRKAQVNGSLVHITAIFGFTLSGLVIKDITDKIQKMI